MTPTAPRMNPTELRQSGTPAKPGTEPLAGLSLAQPRRLLKSGSPVVRQGSLPEFKSLQHNDLNHGTFPPPYGGQYRTAGLPPRGWAAQTHLLRSDPPGSRISGHSETRKKGPGTSSPVGRLGSVGR